jgi:hypothetical protein
MAALDTKNARIYGRSAEDRVRLLALLACNSQQHRHGNGFIIPMPEWRDAASSICTD